MAYDKSLVLFLVLCTGAHVISSVEAYYGYVHQVDPVTYNWVSNGDDGDLWALDTAGVIYHYEAGVFVVKLGRLREISVGAAGVWGLAFGGEAFKWNPKINNFERIPGVFNTLSSGAKVWAVNNTGVYQYRGNRKWTFFPGNLKSVSASDSGVVWGLSADGTPYQLVGRVWKRMPGGPLNQITVGLAGVYGKNLGNIVRIFDGSDFIEIDGDFSQIDSGKFLYGIDGDRKIRKRTPAP